MDQFSIPAGILRHFDLTSIPSESLQARRPQYPGGLLFIDRLLSLAGIDGKLALPSVIAIADSQDLLYIPQLRQLVIDAY